MAQARALSLAGFYFCVIHPAACLGLGAGPGDEGKPNSLANGPKPLPTDPEELQELCSLAGLNQACNQLEHDAAKTPPRQGAQSFYQKDLSKHSDDSGRCLPAGRLVFAHVMKTGGLTVDAFLNCRCSQASSCTVRHADGAVHVFGPRRCSRGPSICTMHRGVENIAERCGPLFSKAPRVFTVIRDPVERVWSFYNYLKRWYRPYQEHDLASIYHKLGIDLNEGLPLGTHCQFCEGELTNAMTLRYFCPDPDLCEPMLGEKAERRGKLAKALSMAKEVLAKMDSIFLTQDLDYFDLMFDADRRLFPELTDVVKDKSSCHAGKVINGTPKKTELVNETIIRRISHKNRADILLYKHAWTLPNMWRLGPSSVPGEGTPWFREFEPTKHDTLLEVSGANEFEDAMMDHEDGNMVFVSGEAGGSV